MLHIIVPTACHLSSNNQIIKDQLFAILVNNFFATSVNPMTLEDAPRFRAFSSESVSFGRIFTVGMLNVLAA